MTSFWKCSKCGAKTPFNQIPGLCEAYIGEPTKHILIATPFGSMNHNIYEDDHPRCNNDEFIKIEE